MFTTTTTTTAAAAAAAAAAEFVSLGSADEPGGAVMKSPVVGVVQADLSEAHCPVGDPAGGACGPGAL